MRHFSFYIICYLSGSKTSNKLPTVWDEFPTRNSKSLNYKNTQSVLRKLFPRLRTIIRLPNSERKREKKAIIKESSRSPAVGNVARREAAIFSCARAGARASLRMRGAQDVCVRLALYVPARAVNFTVQVYKKENILI